MKHAIALIAACCILMSFSGCAKIRGERIDFGHNFPCKALRGNVYYITFPDDAVKIRGLKQKVLEREQVCTGSRPGDELTCTDREGQLQDFSAEHWELRHDLKAYKEGFFGWF